jgi:hypothetical protein
MAKPETTFEQLWQAVQAVQVDGRPVPFWYCGDREPEELFRLGGVAPGPIVELGTYTGTGAACLAAGGTQDVYTIDPSAPLWDRGNNVTNTDHHGSCPTERSIETAQVLWSELGLTGRITWVEASCYDEVAAVTVPAEVGLLFVDAEHQTSELTRQLALWAPRVMSGGYLVLHDWGLHGDERHLGAWDVAGVSQAWIDANGGSKAWTGPHIVSTLAWYRRKPVAEEA